MEKNDKIYVAGRGLIGISLSQKLNGLGFNSVVSPDKKELDLFDEIEVNKFFLKEKPKYVFLAAGKVGGITANDKYPAEFIYNNLKININLIHNSYKAGVKKLLYIGCSCLYPKNCLQPMRPEYMLSGPFEPTNNAYSVAKLAGLTMCQAYNKQYGTNFVSCIADNLFGPNDNFDLESSHVIPALIRKFHEAKTNKEKEITLLGTGKSVRAFTYVDDISDVLIFLMDNYDETNVINVGSGSGFSIKELATIIKEVVGFSGRLVFDTDKPDGAPEKVLDTTRLKALGWKPKTSIRTGLERTYDWYLKNITKVRKGK